MLITDGVSRIEQLSGEAEGFTRDTVTLGWEDRAHVHGRRRTDGGVEFGTALPRGTVLRAGDCFVFAAARLIVSIVELPEAVLVIEPRSPQEWALFAYQIGNRHQPVMITDKSLVCPDVPGIEPMLRRRRIPFTRDTRPFAPTA